MRCAFIVFLQLHFWIHRPYLCPRNIAFEWDKSPWFQNSVDRWRTRRGITSFEHSFVNVDFSGSRTFLIKFINHFQDGSSARVGGFVEERIDEVNLGASWFKSDLVSFRGFAVIGVSHGKTESKGLCHWRSRWATHTDRRDVFPFSLEGQQCKAELIIWPQSSKDGKSFGNRRISATNNDIIIRSNNIWFIESFVPMAFGRDVYAY